MGRMQELVNQVVNLLTPTRCRLFTRSIANRHGGSRPAKAASGESAASNAVFAENASSDSPAASVDGEVAYRDGHFHITDPVGGGLPPVLVPDESVVLTIEGREIEKPVSVWSGANLQVRPRLPDRPVQGFRIDIAPDRMSAYLSTEQPGPPGYRVKDVGPAHVIRLVSEPLPGRQLSPTVDEVEQALRAAGVVMGIDRDAIRRALEQPQPVTAKVASGIPAQPGSPGSIVSKVDAESGETSFGLGLRVECGQPLAVLTPSQEGQSGCDVLGNTLEPTRTKRIRLMAGYGACLSGDGTEAVAAIAGRPVLLQMETDVYRAAVVPVAEVQGPLTDGGAPHWYEGDVVINGDVGGGVTIHAGGWIWVKGCVHGATLEAGQGIRVERSVKWSRLITRATRNRLIPLQQRFDRLLSSLDRIADCAELITKHPRYEELSRSRSFGEIMLALAKQQFGDLVAQIQRARQTLHGLTVLRTHVDLEAILNTLEYRLYAGSLESIDELRQIRNALCEALQRAVDILGASGHNAPVHVNVLIGSEVDAEGDVIAYGTGIELTAVTARGRVQAKNLRDVRVMSHLAIEADVAVASTLESMSLKVSPGGEIRIGLAPKEVQVQVGNWSQILEPESRNVVIESDSRGRVTLTSDMAFRTWLSSPASASESFGADSPN